MNNYSEIKDMVAGLKPELDGRTKLRYLVDFLSDKDLKFLKSIIKERQAFETIGGIKRLN